MTYTDLSNFIWTIADDVLRGLFKNHEYGDVIMPFLVLRRLDCVLEPYKDKAYKLYEQYKDKIDDPAPIITLWIPKQRWDFHGIELVALDLLKWT